jgi:hypothetical protein
MTFPYRRVSFEVDWLNAANPRRMLVLRRARYTLLG